MVLFRSFGQKHVVRLIAIFVLTSSASLVPGLVPGLVHGDLLPSTGNTPATQWVPAGPASDKIFYTFYNSATSELNAICAVQPAGCIPSIDLTDVPLPASDFLAGGCTTNCADTDPRFWVTPDHYPYVKGWTGVSDSAGIGTAQGNPWTLLNAWNGNPAIAGPTIRWGQKSATASLNPYTFSSVVEADVLQEVYDSLLVTNPASHTQIIGWMASSYNLETNAQDPACPTVYTNTRGTFAVGACVKIVMRGDIAWHDMIGCGAPLSAVCQASHIVTASDVKFSFASFNSTGGRLSPGTANTIDVVYNPNQLPANAFSSVGGANNPGISETFYIYLHNFNAGALNDIATVPIVPQRLWVNQTTAPILANGVFAPCTDLGTVSCIVAPGFVSGPSSDPIATNKFVGSGPYVCASGDLATSGTVIGGGCTSSGTGAIPFGGSATFRRFSLSTSTSKGLDPNFAYFKTNAKFLQFQWAAFQTGVAAAIDDQRSAVVSCKANVAGLGGVNDYASCQHWNSTDAGLATVSGAGAAIGVNAGGHGTLPSNPIQDTVQINQWIGRGAWCFGAPSNLCRLLSGVQAIPQTLYEDGSAEGSFGIVAAPTNINTPPGIPASATVSVFLSGGPDNNFTGTVPVTLTTVQSPGLTATLNPNSVTLNPGSPTTSVMLTVNPSAAGSNTVIVKAFVNASPPTFPAVTVTICVNGGCAAPCYGSCSTTTTQVINDVTNAPPTGSETSGASFHDTAIVSALASGVTPSGSATYQFFTNNVCSGSLSTSQSVTLTSTGSVPNSASTGPLNPGSYSYKVLFMGSSTIAGSNSTCEPFSVIADFAIHSSSSMVVVDAGFNSGNTIWLDYPNYPFIPNYPITLSCDPSLLSFGISCNFNPTTATPPFASSLIVTTTFTTPLGSYTIIVTGTGGGLTRTTQFTLTVVTGSVSVATVIKDPSSGRPVSSVVAGNPVHDSATLSGVTSGAGGTVTYSLFNNGSCSGTTPNTFVVTVTNGVVPDSSGLGTSGMPPGSYSFNVVYSGDASNNGATSPCEPFTITSVASVSVASVIKDPSSGRPVSSVIAGNPVHDSATLSGITSNAGGSVTYQLFNNGACSGAPFRSESDPVTNGVVPDSSGLGTSGLPIGSYSFNVVYSGDASNNGATSPCEPFTITSGAPVGGTVLPTAKLALLLSLLPYAPLLFGPLAAALAYYRKKRRTTNTE